MSEFYGKNKIKYSLDSGSTFKELLFANGNDSYGDMFSYIAEFLSVNEGIEDSPIKLDFDLTSFKVLITLYSNTQLDLRNVNFGDLIGFDNKIVKETEYGSKLPNITNGIDSIYIHCDLITSSVVDGKYGDVIYVFSIANLTSSYPFERTPYNIGFSRVNKTRIDPIRVWVTDATITQQRSLLPLPLQKVPLQHRKELFRSWRTSHASLTVRHRRFNIICMT